MYDPLTVRACHSEHIRPPSLILLAADWVPVQVCEVRI